ncbi:MAG: outer membrane beta-barrel protein [Planctomycetota bacterium]
MRLLAIILALGIAVPACQSAGQALDPSTPETRPIAVTVYGGVATGQVRFDGEVGASLTEDYDTGGIAGLRIGTWHEVATDLDLGVALDGSWYVAERSQPSYRFTTVTLSPLAMARFSPRQVPVWPYMGVGPAIAYQDADLGTSGAFTFKDEGFAYGLDARAGLEIPIGPNVAIDLGYRFLYLENTFKSPSLLGTVVGNVDTTETSHFGLVGISFRF